MNVTVDHKTRLRKLPEPPSSALQQTDVKLKAPDGRMSVDSAYFDYQSVDEADERSESCLSVSSFPNRDATSPVPGKRWMVIVDLIREKRRKAAEEGKKKIQELELLKSTLEQTQVKSRTLEYEIEPLKEKLKHCKGLIKDLEGKIHSKNEAVIHLEKSHANQLSEFDKQKQKEHEEGELQMLDLKRKHRDSIREFKNKNDSLSKQLFELNSQWKSKEVSELSGSGNLKDKQLANMKTELIRVRQILESSEQDRLKERKEKLAVVQNMIQLTKQKSDIEEKLDESVKSNTQEGWKYDKLLEKYESTANKLRLLEEEGVVERTEIQKKYLEDIRNLELKFERNLYDIDAKRKSLEKSLNAIRLTKQKHAEETIEDLDTIEDASDIISSLEQEGLYQPGTNGKELLMALFSQYKQMCEKLRTSDELLNNVSKPDARPLMETLKNDNRQLKRKLEDSQNALTAKEGELRITEVSSKKQIESLLSEKKKLHKEMQKSQEDTELHKEEAERLKSEVLTLKESLTKKVAELAMLRDNLMGVTNELKSIDADFGKSKRDIATKDVEITRLNQDLINEQELRAVETSNNTAYKKDISEKQNVIWENEKKIATLQEKICDLEENFETNKLQLQRMVGEREDLKNEVLLLKNDNTQKLLESKELQDVIQLLKTETSSLDARQTKKIEQLSTALIKADHLETELLATQHLLSEEEKKTTEYEQDIEQLTLELENKVNLLMQTEKEKKAVNSRLKKLRDQFEDIEVDSHDKELLLDEHSTAYASLEKQLSDLRSKHKEILLECKELKEKYATCEEKLNDQIADGASLQQKYNETKKELHEKNKMLNERITLAKQLQKEVDCIKYELQTGSSEDATVSGDIPLATQVQKLRVENEEFKGEQEKLLLDLDKKKEETIYLQEENLRLKNAFTKYGTEKPIQIAVQNTVESAVPLFDDFVILDEKQPYNEQSFSSADENILGTLRDAVNQLKHEGKNKTGGNEMKKKTRQPAVESLQDELNLLMDESHPVFQDDNYESDMAKLEMENTRMWNDSLNKENQIKTLETQLCAKETEQKCLEQQINALEEQLLLTPQKDNRTKNELNEIENEMRLMKKEKNEAVECLKGLVVDNEMLLTYVKDQQQQMTQQKKKNQELKSQLDNTLEYVHDQEEMLAKTKDRLRNVMQTSITKESNMSEQQKQEIEKLNKEVDLLREEKRKLQLDVEDKSYEIRKTQDDLHTLRGAIEFNLGSLEAEKRSRDFIEDQLKMVVQDRGHTLQKLKSTELSNKMLQAKLMDLQKWHNNLEISMLKAREFQPITLDSLKSKPTTIREQFTNKQIKMINNKI